MTDIRILIIGATGETGKSIIDGLVEYGYNKIRALIRPASIDKPEVAEIKAKGVEIVQGSITDPVEKLASLLEGIHTVIISITPGHELLQIPLVDAAKIAGVKRIVPALWATVAPPGGILTSRDLKEEVLQHIRKLALPYTAIDVGFWYQISIPTVPSGKLDYALFPPLSKPTICGDGNVKSVMIDIRDIGLFVARIIKDERTLNKLVLAYGANLSQNEVFELVEKFAGERIQSERLSASEIQKHGEEALKAYEANKSDQRLWMGLYLPQYQNSKHIRGDNTPEYAKYLGYLDATELYPDFEPRSFESYLKELVDGKAIKVYS